MLALSATLAFSMRYDNEIPSTPALIDARPSAGLPRHVQPMMVWMLPPSEAISEMVASNGVCTSPLTLKVQSSGLDSSPCAAALEYWDPHRYFEASANAVFIWAFGVTVSWL